MDHWKKQGIENFLIEIEKYYEDCSSDYFSGMSIVDKLNKEESKYLNEVLDLPKIVGASSKYILNETLKDKSKNKFAYFLLRSKNIELEVNNLDDSKKTVFIRLAENYISEKNGFLIYSINELFGRNYKIKEEDVVFINKIYKQLKSQSEQESWYLLRFAVILNDTEKFKLVYQKQREMFVILSLKLQKPIHFNFPNLLGVLNNAIQHYRESGDIILHAMNIYKQSDLIRQLDARKGNFNRKLQEYHQNKPFQDKEFEEVVKLVFPELK
jgi:hypothetical protein